MYKLKKKFSRQKKQGKDKASDEPLLKKITRLQHTETTDEEQNIDTPDQSGASSGQSSTEFQVSEEEVLSILRKILSTKSNPQDLENATETIKQWGQQNGVTMDKKEGSYSQDWLCEFLQLIDESVERHFHILPEDETQTTVQLEQFEDIICSEVCRLTPVLKDAGLLGYLTDSYSRQLFPKLDLIVHKELSVNETVFLLQWGKRVFFSPDYKDAFNVLHDPLLLTGWFERAKHKLLTVHKHDTSRDLQNILCNEKKHDNNEMSEEWFIRVHIDVIQYLSAAIQNAKKVSLTLMNSVQILCLEELHCFAQMYANGEKKRLQSLDTNFVYLCRIISTCMKLRCFAVQISELDTNETADILKMLEDQVLSVVQKKIKDLARVRIKSCFKNGNEHINNLEEIQKLCAPLSQIEAAEEIKTIIVNLAYDCVCRVYLDCLMKTDFEKLERKWENAEERIRQHIQIFQNQFAQMNCNVEQNQLLERMSEVLFCSDVEALKLTCSTLFSDFPEESKHYLHGLLHCKRTLSKRQVMEILGVARLGCQNPASSTDSKEISCLFCYHCC